MPKEPVVICTLRQKDSLRKGENPMCETCSHMLKQAMNGKLCCNCRESEYYDTTVAADHVCDKYIAV